MKPTEVRTIPDLLSYYLHRYVEEHCLDYTRQNDACKPLCRAFETLAPGNLNSGIIKQYCLDRYEGQWGRMKVGESTVRRELVTLISALNYAVDQRILHERDFPKIDLPPAAPPKDLWLEEDELDSFVALSAKWDNGRMSRIHRFTVIVSETAARKNAVQTLTWPQVNFAGGYIEFDKDGKRQKNKRRVKVPISDALMPVLRRAYAERLDGCEYVLDSPYSIQHAWDRLRDAACEQLGEKFQEVTPHTLRHTWATLAAKNGVSLRQIAGVLGASEKTVEKVYAHHSPSYLKKAINHRKKS